MVSSHRYLCAREERQQQVAEVSSSAVQGELPAERSPDGGAGGRGSLSVFGSRSPGSAEPELTNATGGDATAAADTEQNS